MSKKRVDAWLQKYFSLASEAYRGSWTILEGKIDFDLVVASLSAEEKTEIWNYISTGTTKNWKVFQEARKKLYKKMK